MTIQELSVITHELSNIRENIKKTEVDYSLGLVHLARLRVRSGTLAIRLPFHRCNELVDLEQSKYFLSEHYRGFPYVTVKLTAISSEECADLLEESCNFARLE
jgi:hypothetical protein